jgi:PAS domain S-box-containing protein
MDHASEDMALAFDLAGVGLIVSKERIIQHCNNAVMEIFGYSVRQLEGQSLECLYPSHAEFGDIGARARDVLIATGRYSDERIMRRRDGSLFWCRVVGRALHRERPFSWAVWVVEDISGQRPVRATMTSREREIARLLVLGRTSKAIARELSISPRTVEGHRSRLMRKLSATSAAELISKLLGAPSSLD